jgi:carboxypeptidase family protein
MSAKKRRIDQLQIVSPCSMNWDRMSGDEKKRYCAECDKFVYDFSQMTRRQVEAIVSINRGRMCARITRRPDGSMLTLETPTVHSVVARRPSPVVNAALAAILGLSVPATHLNADISVAYGAVRSDADNDDDKTPHGGGEALVGGTVFDPQGAALADAVVKLISDEGAELETKTSGEGAFTFAKVPYGAYIMLVEAQGFYTHVNSNVIVDTPYDTRLEVSLNVEHQILIAGGIGGPAPSLLDLYRESDLVAIAQIGRSTVAETEDNMKLLKTVLRVSSQLKGENYQQVIPFYHWVADDYQTSFKPGDKLLFLLRHRESKEGARMDGYEAAGWGNGVKQLDDGALAIYQQRIEELTEIFRQGDPDPAELDEWLVRCVEEPATRKEGVRELSQNVSLLEFQRERENKSKPQSVNADVSAGPSETGIEDLNEDRSVDGRSEWRRKRVQLAAALTQSHKTRLANALFNIAALSKDDVELAELIRDLGDERLAPYLVSQLRRVADNPPPYAESLIRMIAVVINDEDLKLLSNEYDNAALTARFDSIESDNESDQRDSSQNQRADGLTVAAIKRSAMLKDFLKLVEYKTKR